MKAFQITALSALFLAYFVYADSLVILDGMLNAQIREASTDQVPVLDASKENFRAQIKQDEMLLALSASKAKDKKVAPVQKLDSSSNIIAAIDSSEINVSSQSNVSISGQSAGGSSNYANLNNHVETTASAVEGLTVTDTGQFIAGATFGAAVVIPPFLSDNDASTSRVPRRAISPTTISR